MSTVHAPVITIKMPTIIQRHVSISRVPSVHLTKLERGLVQHSLLYCFEKGYFSLIRYLLQSGLANSREKDGEGRNGLMYCCFIDNDCWAQNIAMTLLEYDAKIEDRDQRGLNALHYAIITERLILVRRYLASIDFDLSQAIDIFGNTSLHYACSTGNLDIVRCVLDTMKRYAIDLTVKNNYGSTAYDIACQLKHERCQNLLRNEMLLRESNNQKLKHARVYNKTIKNLLERRSSIPIRIHPVPPITHTNDSVASVPIIMSNSTNIHFRSPSSLNFSKENVPCSSSVFIDPIESRNIKLKHNESLDLSLVKQAKARADFVSSLTASPSTIFTSSSSTWRDDFSKMFNQLQTFKTPSYRKTVHAPLSSELSNDFYEHFLDHDDSDGRDSSHHRLTSPARAGGSQKIIHRRRSSTSSNPLLHKAKK